MNHKQILELTLRLSKALDQNYDVVDMEVVLSIIESLERTPITKEQLEVTRLAKYINQLRRRTKCEHLARRSKSLLKKWREMVGMQSTNELNISENSTLIYNNDNAAAASSFDSGINAEFTTRFEECQKGDFQAHMTPSLSFTKTNNFNSTQVETASKIKALILQNNKKDCEDLSYDLQHLKQQLDDQTSSFAKLMETLDNSASDGNFKLCNPNTECTDLKISKMCASDSPSNYNSKVLQMDEFSVNSSDHDIYQTNVNSDNERCTINSEISRSKVFPSSLHKGNIRQINNVTIFNFSKNVEVNDTILNIKSIVNNGKFNQYKSESETLLKSTALIENVPTANTSIKPLMFDDSLKFMQEVPSNNQNIIENNQLLQSQNPISKSNISGKDLTFTGQILHLANEGESNETTLINTISNVGGDETIFNPHVSPRSTLREKCTALHRASYNKCNENLLPLSDKNERNGENSILNVNKANALLIDTLKLPKKRGRKRGSKAAKSILTKQLSLSAEMLVAPFNSVKKVKTTKELYAEIKNRSISLKQDSDISTTTFYNDGNESQYPKLCNRYSFLDIENCEVISEFQANLNSGTTKIHQNDDFNSNIKEELFSLIKQLPPVPTVEDIEEKCSMDIIPCTCIVVEVQSQRCKFNQNPKESNNKFSNFKEYCPDKLNHFLEYQQNLMSDNMESPVCHPVQTRVKSNKSIFDLDFNDNEGNANDSFPYISKISVKDNHKNEYNVNDSTKTLDIPHTKYLTNETINLDDNHMNNEFDSNNENLFSIFQIQIDPNCRARYSFEVQTQQITKFHVNALHNYFIPNINGNWNAEVNNFEKKDDLLQFDENYNSYNVVPPYGSLMNKYFNINFNDLEFRKYFKLSSKISSTSKENAHIPFLGVARQLNLHDKHTYKMFSKKKRKCKRYICKNNTYESRIKTVISYNNEITDSNKQILYNNLERTTSSINQHKNTILDEEKSIIPPEASLISKKQIKKEALPLNAELKINVIKKSNTNISKRIVCHSYNRRNKFLEGNTNFFIKKYIKYLLCRNSKKNKNKQRSKWQRNDKLSKSRNSNINWCTNSLKKENFSKLCDYNSNIKHQTNKHPSLSSNRQCSDQNLERKHNFHKDHFSSSSKDKFYSNLNRCNMILGSNEKTHKMPCYIEKLDTKSSDNSFQTVHKIFSSFDFKSTNDNHICNYDAISGHSTAIFSDDFKTQTNDEPNEMTTNSAFLQSFNNLYKYPIRRYQMIANKMNHKSMLEDSTSKCETNSNNYNGTGNGTICDDGNCNLHAELSMSLKNSSQMEENVSHNFNNIMFALERKRCVDEKWQQSNHVKCKNNNWEQIQTFKEWHEVLQLHTYNNEILTALPYVILE